MSLVTVVTGDQFNVDVDIAVPNLPRVGAPAEVESHLKNANIGPSGGQSMVTTICRVDETGITEVNLQVVGKNRKVLVARANKVWAEALDVENRVL